MASLRSMCAGKDSGGALPSTRKRTLRTAGSPLDCSGPCDTVATTPCTSSDSTAALFTRACSLMNSREKSSTNSPPSSRYSARTCTAGEMQGEPVSLGPSNSALSALRQFSTVESVISIGSDCGARKRPSASAKKSCTSRWPSAVAGRAGWGAEAASGVARRESSGSCPDFSISFTSSITRNSSTSVSSPQRDRKKVRTMSVFQGEAMFSFPPPAWPGQGPAHARPCPGNPSRPAVARRRDC